MSKIAICSVCKEPLIFTFFFSKKEFICLNCGRLYEYFGPNGAIETPELLEKMKNLKEEWERDFTPYLLTGGIMKESCETCRINYEPHLHHATDEELEKHTDALIRLKERTGNEQFSKV